MNLLYISQIFKFSALSKIAINFTGDGELLDDETLYEIEDYANNIGIEDFYLELDTMEDKEDIEYWLKNKIKFEGKPNKKIVDLIDKSGKINRPVILDVDYTVEGRHRLAAALKYNLPVPVVTLSRSIIDDYDDENYNNEELEYE